MIDRSATTHTPDAAAAQRRVFRSKVDTIRPTYGFDDVSLAPGTDTIEPSDVDLSQTFCGIDLAIPILASAMDAVVDARMAGALALVVIPELLRSYSDYRMLFYGGALVLIILLRPDGLVPRRYGPAWLMRRLGWK